MAVAYASHTGASLATLGSTDMVIPKPTGTVEGDLLTTFIILTANATVTPPAGWTTVVNAAGVKAYWKIAGPSEPASYTFTRGLTTNNAVGQMARLTGADTTNPVDTLGAVPSGSSSTAVLPSINVTDGFFLWQQVAVIANATWTPPGTATEDYDYQPPPQAFGVAAGHETVGAGSTGTRTWTASASSTRSGVVWALRAAPVPPADLVPDDTTHAHTSDAASLTQTHELAPADAAHAHATDQAALTQVHVLTPAGSDHTHGSESAGLTQVHQLAPADTAHGHSSDTATVTQLHQLAPAETSHAHATESTSIAQVHQLVPADSGHEHSSTATTLTQVHELAPDDSLHTHTSDSTSVNEDGGIITLHPDDTTHSHTTQATSLAQVHQMQPHGTVHAHTSESTAVTLPAEPSSARTSVVAAENRTSAVPAEPRRGSVPAESRTSAA